MTTFYKRKRMKTSSADSIGLAAIFMYIAFVLVAGYGYFHNIFQIIHELGGPLSAMFVARCVGAFVVPLGVILGLFS
jgi:hypothetical protein